MSSRETGKINKVKACILGTGNIGIDLLYKLQRSEFVECSLFAGRRSESTGIKIAREMNIPVTDKSINAVIENPEVCDIVFDATTASQHVQHAPILRDMGKFAIDLTPSLAGEMCVPVINSDKCIDLPNVNMVTCGGQATVPIAHAICSVIKNTEYVEIVAGIASKSAGPGTRANIDEFTQTTKEALLKFTGCSDAKAIIILNPAEPPITMHNTVYVKAENPDMEAIEKSLLDMERRIRSYVPGFKITTGPVFENGRITTMIEVVGLGDYLPTYSGNLDIITCAAVNIADAYAVRHSRKKSDFSGLCR